MLGKLVRRWGLKQEALTHHLSQCLGLGPYHGQLERLSPGLDLLPRKETQGNG